MVDVWEVKERVIEDNDAESKKVQAYLSSRNVFMVNLMGSPGAGKTTTLLRIIENLKDSFRIGVMEADVDSKVDAETIAKTGVRTVQLHTGGSCHMDADMTLRGLNYLDAEGLDAVFLENIGNLVCPAEFDVGAAKKVMILSVPEGDDKPLKYPLMFKVSDCLLINKIDTAPVFDFDMDRLHEHVSALNPDMPVFPVSSKTGEGFEVFTDWLKKEILSWRKQNV